MVKFGAGDGPGKQYTGKSYVGLGVCPVCGEASGVLMDKRLQDTFEDGKKYPLWCKKCEDVVKGGGAWLIEVRDGESGENPYRTGKVVAMSKQWVDRTGWKHPMSYIEQSVLKQLMGDQYDKEVG